MGATFIRAALRSAQAQIRHVTPIPPRRATGLVARVYQQVERDFGMLAPPISLHSPAPGPLAAAWVMLRESLVAKGVADRGTKEAVAAAVSVGNACPYCVEVHGSTLNGLVTSADVAAIEADRIDSVADPRLRAIAAWARSGAGGAASIPEGQRPELVGVAVSFHYLNRMVNVFLGGSPLPPNVPASARGPARRFLGWFMRLAAGDGKAPGASLELLPAAPRAADLAWTVGSTPIALGFSRAYAAIELAGARSVPQSVRELVTTQLSIWDGQPPGLGRGWTDEMISYLPEDDRVAGRLAVLTAMAAYQVDEQVIAKFRREHDDEALINLTSWASLAAARAVSGRLLIASQAPPQG